MTSKKKLPPRIVVEVAHVMRRHLLDGNGWRCKVYDASKHCVYFAKQSISVDFARDTCQRRAREGDLLELVVKAKATGRIRYRDTYPRSSDPKRSKG